MLAEVSSGMWAPEAQWVQDEILHSSGEREGIVGRDPAVEAVFPKIRKAAAVMNAAQGDDLVGALGGPEHARFFAAKAAVLHAGHVALEIAQSFFDLRRLGVAPARSAGLDDDPLDAIQKEHFDPVPPASFELRSRFRPEDGEQFFEVFEGVVKINDLRVAREVILAQLLQTCRAIDEEHGLFGLAHAAPQGFAPQRDAEVLRSA